jgi:hypothetical protein
MQPNPPIPGIRQTITIVDDNVTLVTAIKTDLSAAEVWAVKRDGTSHRIGRSEPGVIGKVDSASARAFRDGTVRLMCSAAFPGGGGATSHIEFFDFLNVLPAQFK